MEFKHLRSSVAGKLPQPADIDVGQIAINFNDGDPFLSIKDSAGAVRRLSQSNWIRGTNSLYPSVAGDSVLVGGVLPGLPAIALDSSGDGIFTGKLTAGEGYFVGNVGLGTSTPQAALDINAPGSTVPFIASINGSEKARIDLAGNFGVGTATPQTTLDVNGTVRATVFDIESLPALP